MKTVEIDGNTVTHRSRVRVKSTNIDRCQIDIDGSLIAAPYTMVAPLEFVLETRLNLILDLQMKPRYFLCATAATSTAVITVISTAFMLCGYIASLETEMSSDLVQIKVNRKELCVSKKNCIQNIQAEADYLWREMRQLSQFSTISRRIRRQVEVVEDVEALSSSEVEDSSVPTTESMSLCCGAFF